MVSESRTTTSEGSDGIPCCNFPNEFVVRFRFRVRSGRDRARRSRTAALPRRPRAGASSPGWALTCRLTDDANRKLAIILFLTVDTRPSRRRYIYSLPHRCTRGDETPPLLISKRSSRGTHQRRSQSPGRIVFHEQHEIAGLVEFLGVERS